MNKKEVYEIARLIRSYYEQTKFNQEKLDAWYAILQNYEFVKVKVNLEAFVKRSDFPPKMRDLIEEEKPLSSNVPSYEETMTLFGVKAERSSSTVVQEELAKMREILGIRRDENDDSSGNAV